MRHNCSATHDSAACNEKWNDRPVNENILCDLAVSHHTLAWFGFAASHVLRGDGASLVLLRGRGGLVLGLPDDGALLPSVPGARRRRRPGGERLRHGLLHRRPDSLRAPPVLHVRAGTLVEGGWHSAA